MGKIVYILSDNRSGSTLLDQLLGAYSQVVSLGEVHHLPAYALEDRTLYNPVHPLTCSCGATVAACPFWHKIECRLGRPFGSLILVPRHFGWREGTPNALHVGTLARRIINRFPQAYLSTIVQNLFNGSRIASDSFDLFDAIFAETGATYLIDSSKLPFLFRSLYDHRPDSVFAISLRRDYRGVVYSKMKRGSDLESSAKSWATRMRQIEALTVDIPQRQLIHLRYEDLCQDPRKELRRLCDFLQLEFADSLLSRPTVDSHHIGGSPSKFDPARKEIELDLSYLSALSESEYLRMRQVIGDSAVKWGYD